MTKTKTYKQVKFSPDVIVEALSAAKIEFPRARFEVETDKESWRFDQSAQAEAFSIYRQPSVEYASLVFSSKEMDKSVSLTFGWAVRSKVSVQFNTREEIEQVFEVFEKHAVTSRVDSDSSEAAIKKRLRIFIGHGGDLAWRDVRDHLQDKHGFKAIAFETGPRVGLQVTEVLEDLEENASFAILVMTGENTDASGKLHARENVIHEVGLFQGRLGLKRAIVLLEEGCAEFSNMAGVQYIPFAKGNVKETFGDIVATIRREFLEPEDE